MQSFDKSDKSALQEGWKLFTQSRSLIKNCVISWEQYVFPWHDPLLMLISVLTTSPQTLGQMADRFWLNVRKRFKFSFTDKNPSSPWTGRLLFWRSLLRTFDERPLFFSSLSGNEWEIHNFFPQFLSSKCFYGQVDCSFDNPDKNVLREGREFFTPCPKMIQISNFFKTINISPTCSLAHVECNFDNP